MPCRIRRRHASSPLAGSLTMRSMRLARSGLCVAISAARPVVRTSFDQCRERRRRRCAGRGCRSARRPAGSRGSLASARTIATRCCSPPDSRAGRCVERARRARPIAAARPRGPLASPRAHAGDHLRQHDVLERRELRQQVMELVDEAEMSRAAAPCARRRRMPVAGAGRRAARRRHRRAPAGRRHAAASTCRRRTGRPARRSRPRLDRQGRRRAATSSGAVGLFEAPDDPRQLERSAASLIAQRLDRIEARGAPGRIDRREERQRQRHQRRPTTTSVGSTLAGSARGSRSRRRTACCRSGPAATAGSVSMFAVNSTPSREAEQRADDADAGAGQEEDAQDRAARRAHRAQDGDVARPCPSPA